eukprot:SRR837773.11609.p1 GENE.SRR837773.11609~~SRR837773.11609.p1  ORF type:complete len:385 (-),score=117.68 SRR837773.11609:47-1093(-)
MYDFGGGIHCSTWDIQREDSCKDYFPEQECSADALLRSVFSDSKFEDVEVVDVGVSNDGFVLNPMSGLATGTWMNKQQRDKDKGLNTHSHSHSECETSADIFKRSGAGGSFKVKGDHSSTWGGTIGNTELTVDTLRIDDQPVMESWETPYMHRLADVACEVGGDLLEVGFGLGLSGRRVQTHANVKSHTVIEANDKVFASLQQFAKEEEAAGRPKVIPEHGLWVDVVDRLVAQGRKFDVILYDPYPQNESEQHVHQFLFIATAWELLKPGGRFVYCNLTSIGKLKESFDTWQDLWDKSQLPYLTRKPKLFKPENTSFSLFEFDQATKTARGHCEYYMHDHALVPVCTK